MVALVALVVGDPAQAAAPRYILVSGPGLDRPVLMGDWDENLRFLVALLPARPVHGFTAAGRPRYDLAMFWGVPAKPVPTRPADSGQHASFYPAVGKRPAVVDLHVGPLLAGARERRTSLSRAVCGVDGDLAVSSQL